MRPWFCVDLVSVHPSSVLHIEKPILSSVRACSALSHSQEKRQELFTAVDYFFSTWRKNDLNFLTLSPELLTSSVVAAM